MSFPTLWKTTEREEVKEVEIKTKQVERTRLNIPHPAPVDLSKREITWKIVTEDNVADIFAQLKTDGADPVFFALTDDGYKELSLTIAEIRNYIASQRSIIIKYKEYYEPEIKDGTNGQQGSTN